MTTSNPATPDGMGDIKGSMHHDVRYCIKPPSRQILCAADEITRRVVDQPCQGPILKDLLDHGVDSLSVAYIDPERFDLSTMALHQLSGSFVTDALSTTAN